MPAERDAAAIRADIDRARAEIAHGVDVIREQVRERADWRTWVRERPLPVLGAAFAVGFFFGWRR